MPMTSGKAVGSQSVAKAGVNLEVKTASLAAGTTLQSKSLITAGMPKLTWLVSCAQAHSMFVQPQVAYRRLGAGVEAYEFMDAGPQALVSSSSPYTLELNAPAQAMRVEIINPSIAGTPAATSIIVVLMASG